MVRTHSGPYGSLILFFIFTPGDHVAEADFALADRLFAERRVDGDIFRRPVERVEQDAPLDVDQFQFLFGDRRFKQLDRFVEVAGRNEAVGEDAGDFGRIEGAVGGRF